MPQVAYPNPCLSVRPVDEPTLDVTSLGVEGLASGVPEWTRDWLPRRPEDRMKPRAPSDDGLRRLDAPSTATAGIKIARGAYLSVRWATFTYVDLTRDSVVGSSPGLRCVVEPE